MIIVPNLLKKEFGDWLCGLWIRNAHFSILSRHITNKQTQFDLYNTTHYGKRDAPFELQVMICHA